MPGSLEQNTQNELFGGFQILEFTNGSAYCIQRAKNGVVWIQQGSTPDASETLYLLDNYTASPADEAWLDDPASNVETMPEALRDAFLNKIRPRPVPNPAGTSFEQPKPPRAEDNKPVYDSQVIAALEDVLRVLDRLATKNEGFRTIRDDLLNAVRQENMPITLSVDSHAASTSTSTPTPTQSAPAPTSEAPVSPQEHLALLEELKTKLNKLKTTHQHAIPAAVHDVLNQLEGQVDASIRIVTQDIANKKAEQQEIKSKLTSGRATATPGLFESNPTEQVEVSQQQERARSNSI